MGEHGNPGQCAYSASKAGLSGFTKSLAKEVASRNIHVNLIAPGWCGMSHGVWGNDLQIKWFVGKVVGYPIIKDPEICSRNVIELHGVVLFRLIRKY